jgi:hypothetical protein
MATYTPDAWVILKITPNDGEPHHKVLAGWSGSYTYGASWKLNSGITKITYQSTATMEWYDIEGHSGSVYRCGKSKERMSAYMASVLDGFMKDIEGHGTIEIIDIKDILKDYE